MNAQAFGKSAIIHPGSAFNIQFGGPTTDDQHPRTEMLCSEVCNLFGAVLGWRGIALVPTLQLLVVLSTWALMNRAKWKGVEGDPLKPATMKIYLIEEQLQHSSWTMTIRHTLWWFPKLTPPPNSIVWVYKTTLDVVLLVITQIHSYIYQMTERQMAWNLGRKQLFRVRSTNTGGNSSLLFLCYACHLNEYVTLITIVYRVEWL